MNSKAITKIMLGFISGIDQIQNPPWTDTDVASKSVALGTLWTQGHVRRKGNKGGHRSHHLECLHGRRVCKKTPEGNWNQLGFWGCTCNPEGAGYIYWDIIRLFCPHNGGNISHRNHERQLTVPGICLVKPACIYLDLLCCDKIPLQKQQKEWLTLALSWRSRKSL